MSSSTVEKDKAVIRVFLSDGTFKCFMVTESQTPNAVKFMVSKKLGLDPKEFSHFGLFVQEDSKVADIGEDRPFALHVKWGAKSGEKFKFLFKRNDEPGGTPSTHHEPSAQTSNAPAPSSSFVPPKGAIAVSPMNMVPNQPHKNSTGLSTPTQYAAPTEMGRVAMPGLAPTMRESQPIAPKITTDSATRQNFHRGIILTWMNRHLEFHGIRVNNLTTDLEDGVALFRLLESITRKKFKGWHTNATNLMFKLDNLNLFLRTLSYFGFKITGVSAEDLFGGNENITLAVLLLLIKRYGDVPPRQAGGANSQESTEPTTTQPTTAPQSKSPATTSLAPPATPLPRPPSAPMDSLPDHGNENETGSTVVPHAQSEPMSAAAKPKSRARGVAQGSAAGLATSPPAPSPSPLKSPPPMQSSPTSRPLPTPPSRPGSSTTPQQEASPQAPSLPDYTEELDLAVAGDLDPDVLLKGWLEELDLGVEVPGSVAANARMTIRARKRASTIRNVNTSVFDIDAFDNMEDLLLKMADGL